MPSFNQIKNKIFRSNLNSFIAKSFLTLNPTTKYLHNWHIDLIAEYLNACYKRQIKRLIINIPPRSLKSISVSVAFPAWILGNNPSEKILVASYASALSLKHSVDCRFLMSQNWYLEVFPELELAPDQNTKHKFVTTLRGHRIAASVGGSITGEGGNFLIVDDPHNPAQAVSQTKRKTALNWFENTFMSRLDDKEKGVVIIVMQRLHTEDLTGYLLNKNSGWEHLCLPAVAEKRTRIYYPATVDPSPKNDAHFSTLPQGEDKSHSKIFKIREAGDILHPNREGKLLIEKAKTELGSYAFAGQYQQRPVPLGGGMIKKHWFNCYKALPASPARIIQSWDTAIKAKQNNDASVCSTWFETKKGYFLADVKSLRAEYPELKRTVINLAEKWDISAILIEDKASGQSLIQDLKQETKLPVIPITPIKDKITRAAQVSALIESGKVFIPEKADWLTDFESEVFSFPNGIHDDQADSMIQFLNWIKNQNKYNITLRKL